MDKYIFKNIKAKTPFYQKEKPTPYDEAQFLIQYLENVFYDTVGQLQDRLSKVIGTNVADSEFHKFFTLGFWPGGDRDGNPFVRVNNPININNHYNTKN